MGDYEFNIFSYIINWMGSDKMSNEKGLLERLASLEHEQWCEWSKSIAKDINNLLELIPTEDLDVEELTFFMDQNARLNRWAKLRVPYEDLSEMWKEEDRKYARKVLKELQK